MITIRNSKEFFKYLYRIDEYDIENLLMIINRRVYFQFKNENIETIFINYNLTDLEMTHLKLYLTYYKNMNKKFIIYFKGNKCSLDKFSKIVNNINNFKFLYKLFYLNYDIDKKNILYLTLIKGKKSKIFLNKYFKILKNSIIIDDLGIDDQFKLLFEIGQIYSKIFFDYNKSNKVYNYLEKYFSFNSEFKSAILNAKALNYYMINNIHTAIKLEERSVNELKNFIGSESYVRSLINLLALYKEDTSNFIEYFKQAKEIHMALPEGNAKNSIGYFLLKHFIKNNDKLMAKQFISKIYPQSPFEYNIYYDYVTDMIKKDLLNLEDIILLKDKIQINYISDLSNLIKKKYSDISDIKVNMFLKNFEKYKENYTFHHL